MLTMDDFKRINITRLAQVAGVSRVLDAQDYEDNYSGKISGGDATNYMRNVSCLGSKLICRMEANRNRGWAV